MGKPKIAVDRDSARRMPPGATDPHAALAAQFIPAGARVGIAGTSPGDALPHGCVMAPHTDADLILALGVLDASENREQYFGSLALMRRPIVIDCRPRDFSGAGPSLAELLSLIHI